MSGDKEKPKQLPLPDPDLQLNDEGAPPPEGSEQTLWKPRVIDDRIERGYAALAGKYGVSLGTVRDAIHKFGTAYEVHLYLISQGAHTESDGE